MGDERGGGEGMEGGGDDVGLGGVEIAAAGVDAEGPGGEAGGLPGGEGEGVVEELGEGGGGEGLWGDGRLGLEDGRVEGLGLILMVGLGREVLEREERGGEVAAERVGLVGPVEAVGSTCIAVEGVLGLVVVFEDLVKILLLLLLLLLLLMMMMIFFFGFGRRDGGV